MFYAVSDAQTVFFLQLFAGHLILASYWPVIKFEFVAHRIQVS